MLHLFWTYVAANDLYCKTRRGRWVQTEVVLSGTAVLLRAGVKRAWRPHMHVQAHAYHSSRRGQGDRHDSSNARTSAAGACLQVGRSYTHVLWAPTRQSGRPRRGARVPSVGRMHPGKCVICVVSCRMQRERVRRTGR
jgi:hypothetical protein